jgi:hypothetical protein
MGPLGLRTRIRAEEAAPDELRYVGVLKKYATRSINQVAHTKDKDKLTTYIAVNFTVSTPTALDVPNSVLKLISDGITALRKNTK